MPMQHRKTLPRAHLPYSHNAVFTPTSELSAIKAKSDRPDPPLLTTEGQDLPVIGHLPHPHFPIDTARCKELAIRAESHRENRTKRFAKHRVVKTRPGKVGIL